MASYNPNNLTTDELSCPICFEEYSTIFDSERVPKLLMCLHTFCLGCVRSLVKSNKTVQCSICRTEHTHVTPHELYDNYVILDYVRKQQEESDARLARQHSEQLMAEDSHLSSSSLMREQVYADAEMARRFQLYYDKGGEDTTVVPDNIDTELLQDELSVRTGMVLQAPEVLCTAQEDQHSNYQTVRLPTCKTRVFPAQTVQVQNSPQTTTTFNSPQTTTTFNASSNNSNPSSSSSSSTSPSSSSTAATSHFTSSSTSDSCTDGRCSSQASTTSRLEDEFVDSVESLESGACYSARDIPVPAVAVVANSSRNTIAVTAGCSSSAVGDDRYSVSDSNLMAGTSSGLTTLPANISNVSGFSCSTYEIDCCDEESDINDDGITDSSDIAEGSDINADIHGDDDATEEEDAEDIDDSMHLENTFALDEHEEDLNDVDGGEEGLEQEDELFLNLDALEEASVDSEMLEQNPPHVVFNVLEFQEDSNSSYNSDMSASPNDLVHSVDSSVRSGYADQQRSSTFIVISEDDTDYTSSNEHENNPSSNLELEKTGSSDQSENSIFEGYYNCDATRNCSQATITLDED